MNGVGAYWSTDHMFGVPSRIVSKYALREPELELRAWIAQSLDRRRRERKNEINSFCQRCLLINQLNAFGKFLLIRHLSVLLGCLCSTLVQYSAIPFKALLKSQARGYVSMPCSLRVRQEDELCFAFYLKLHAQSDTDK